MKENKGKWLVDEETLLETRPSLILLLETKEIVYPRWLIWEIFPIVEEIRRQSTGCPSLGSSNPILLSLLPFNNRPSKFMIWTRLNLLEEFPWTFLRMKILLGKGFKRLWLTRTWLCVMTCPWKNLNTLLFMISSRYVFIILFSFRLVIFHISHLINFNQLHI